MCVCLDLSKYWAHKCFFFLVKEGMKERMKEGMKDALKEGGERVNERRK